MKSKIFGYAGLFLLIVLALALAGCSGKAATAVSAGSATPTTAGGLPPVKSGSSVIAEGKAVPAKDAALSFSSGGVVNQILVSEGDQVQSGQALMRLNGMEKLQSAVSSAELEMLTAQQALDDLNNNSSVDRAQAQQTLALAQKELDKAKKRVYSKDYQRGTQAQVDTARANYVIAENGVKEAEKQYDRVDDRPQDDPIRAELFSQLAAAKQKRDTALANLNYLLDKPNDLDVNEVTANLAVAQAKVDDATRHLDLLKNGPDAEKFQLAQARLKNAQVALTAAQASLKDLQLSAPFDATITSIDINQGEAASPGVAVVHIADFSSWMVETTDLTELNIARVKVGQPVLVRFDAIPGKDFIGRVTKIKPQGENRQGDIVYTVVIRLENPDTRLRWNMTASVTFLEKDAEQ